MDQTLLVYAVELILFNKNLNLEKIISNMTVRLVHIMAELLYWLIKSNFKNDSGIVLGTRNLVVGIFKLTFMQVFIIRS